MTNSRINRLKELISAAGLDALAVNPGPSLVYLTGLHLHLMERPMIALFTPGGESALVIPELELAKAKNLPFSPQVFTYNDDPSTWAAVYRKACAALHLEGKTIGVEPTRLRFLELRILESGAPQAHFVSAQACLAALRIQKDAGEIASMRKAVKMAQDALTATLPRVKAGVTEKEIAAELMMQLLRAGCDPDTAFGPIVSGGPNSANPHATPSDRALVPGDLLVIDWGAMSDGYASDLTRTFAIGKMEPELARIAELVLGANAAGRAAGRPGLPAGAVDHAARAVIEQGGYGAFFTHRTGHGLGMEGHEEPYMYAENTLLLAEGMTYTVEPGIYLPGRNGVRIEDNVVVTANGAESLSDMPRPVAVID